MRRLPLLVSDRRQVARLLPAIVAACLARPSTAHPSRQLLGFVDFVLEGTFYSMEALYRGEDLDSWSVLCRALRTAHIAPTDPTGRDVQERNLHRCERRFVTFDRQVVALHESLSANFPLAA